jgi:subtilisin family serine protease
MNQNQGSSSALVYPHLDVAVIAANPDQISSISSANSELSSRIILTTELEQIIDVEPLPGIQQESQAATWGLVETNVITSPYSGAGIKVAILDTGLDLNHPDFAGRTIISQSFVDGEEVQDLHGHGTHCTGTACGSREPKNTGMRYGIAYEAEIYIGKVLNNKGSGMDNSILAGINWAVSQGCQIISMSIGGLVSVGASYSSIYEDVARRVLKQGTLIVVAAGNDSLRNRTSGPIINPVSRPANCPSMMAVAAIDRNFNIASFSNGGINSDGGEVNIAGPGVDVFSSWPQSRNYNTINGTSMATPHVAGIAALFAQADSKARGRTLWDRLMENARSLNPLTARDVGAGLVQAPQ